MASEISNPTPVVSASARQAAKVKNYVNQQLEKTRKQVKTVDLIAGGLVLVTFVVGFLIIAALVDGWIWPLSPIARWGCLIFLVLGCVAYTLTAIVPLLLKRINPDYAAKMIEEAKPSFKNSLLNYVSLRKKPEALKPAIFDAVSRQAAANLATVPEDATVDRSKLIRLGFVLVGLTLFAVSYKMLSPKDPLQTVARIVFPGGKIAKPAVVRIEDVKPGDAKVFFGEHLEVTAIVRGSHRPEDVRLVYSTLDGQLVDQTILMTPDSTANRYRTELSMAGGGIQQSLSYQVIARDGVSPEYQVTVQPNPAIAIESLVLQPPAYTKMRPRTLVGQGDIDAIEGTKATVHAVANLPIQLAYIELLNEVRDPNQPISEVDYDSRYRLATTAIEMQSEGTSATGSFLVALNSKGDRQIATHYRIRFVSTEDDRNRQPNVYPIRVIPDLAPEIRFRNPDAREIEIPVNGDFPILLEANDLDFEIKAVHLKVEHKGERRLDERLELSSEDGNRRVTAGYRLRPADLGLQAGDTAIFFGTADDNRMSMYSEQPFPNTSRTEDYLLRVVAHDESAEKDPDNQGDSDQPEQAKTGEENKGDDKEENGSEEGKEEPGSEGSDKNEENSDGDDGSENGEQSDNSSDKEPGEEDTENKEPGDKGNDDKEPGKQNNDQPESGEPGKEENPETGEDGESDSSEQSGDGEDSGSGGSAGEQPDQPPESGSEGSGEDGEGGESAGQGADSNSEENSSGKNGDSKSESGDDSSADNGGDSASNPSDGDPESGSDSQDGSNPGAGEGRQDDSLTSGAEEAVSDNASESALIRKMQEHFENEQKESESNNKNEQDDSENSADPNDGSQSGDNANQDADDQKTENGEPGGESESSGDAGKPDGQEGDGTGQPEDETNGEKTAPQNQADSGSSNDNQGQPNSENEDPPSGEPGSGESSSGEPGDDEPKDGESGKQQPGSGETGNAEPKSEDPESGKSEPGDPESGEPEDSESGKGESGSSEPEDGESGKGESGGDPGEGKPGDDEAGGGEPGDTKSENGNAGEGEFGKGGDGKGTTGEGEAESGKAGEGSPGGEGSDEAGTDTSDGEQNMDSKPGDEKSPSAGDQKAGSQPGSSSSGKNPGAGSGDLLGSPSKKPGGTGKGESSAEGDLLKREEVNREHAKKATDLILNKLAEQKNDPDPELLRKLKMSKEQLNEFFDRWDEMKRNAESGDAAAVKKYERELKSLGLKPKGGTSSVQQNQDKVEGLNEDGAVNEPTAELVPDFNTFLRDLGRVRDN